MPLEALLIYSVLLLLFVRCTTTIIHQRKPPAMPHKQRNHVKAMGRNLKSNLSIYEVKSSCNVRRLMPNSKLHALS